MKKIYLLLLTVLSAKSVFTQEQLEDLSSSILQQKINKSDADSNRVKFQLALGRSILFKPGGGKKEIDSATNLMTQAAQLSKSINYRSGSGNAILLSALIYNTKQQKDSGLAEAAKALNYFTTIKDDRGIAESNIIVGQHYDIYKSLDELEKRIKYYKLAAALFEQGGYKLREATT